MSKRTHGRSLSLEECKSWIGKPVAKRSGKPFKSTNKVNIVKDVVDHPNRPDKLAFTFQDDDSIVEAIQCCLFSE